MNTEVRASKQLDNSMDNYFFFAKLKSHKLFINETCCKAKYCKQQDFESYMNFMTCGLLREKCSVVQISNVISNIKKFGKV